MKIEDATKEQHDVLSAYSGFIGAMEIARKALRSIRSALSRGMHHSRKDLETVLPALEAEMQRCKLDHLGPVHINSNVRLFDLVRHQRGELHQAELISDEEYSWLCAGSELATAPEGGSPSPRRLEDYDDMRKKMDEAARTLRAIVQEASKQWIATAGLPDIAAIEKYAREAANKLTA